MNLSPVVVTQLFGEWVSWKLFKMRTNLLDYMIIIGYSIGVGKCQVVVNYDSSGQVSTYLKNTHL